MKLKIGLAQNILYQFNIFFTGTKTNCTKVQIELQQSYTDEIIKLVSCLQHHACISVLPLLALCLWSFSFHMKVCIFSLPIPTLIAFTLT